MPAKDNKAAQKAAIKKATAASVAMAKKQGEGKSGIEKIVQDITNRYRVTAREARDIVTAVSTAGDVAKTKLQGKKFETPKPGSGIKAIAKQVGEVGKAAVTGKPQTTAPKSGGLEGKYYYNSGVKRTNKKGK